MMNKKLTPFFGAHSRVQNFPVKTGQVEMSPEVWSLWGSFPQVSSAPKCPGSSQAPWCELLLFAAIFLTFLCLHKKCFPWHARPPSVSLQSPPFLVERQKYPLCFSSSGGDQIGRVHAGVWNMSSLSSVVSRLSPQSPRDRACHIYCSCYILLATRNPA